MNTTLDDLNQFTYSLVTSIVISIVSLLYFSFAFISIFFRNFHPLKSRGNGIYAILGNIVLGIDCLRRALIYHPKFNYLYKESLTYNFSCYWSLVPHLPFASIVFTTFVLQTLRYTCVANLRDLNFSKIYALSELKESFIIEKGKLKEEMENVSKIQKITKRIKVMKILLQVKLPLILYFIICIFYCILLILIIQVISVTSPNGCHLTDFSLQISIKLLNALIGVVIFVSQVIVIFFDLVQSIKLQLSMNKNFSLKRYFITHDPHLFRVEAIILGILFLVSGIGVSASIFSEKNKVITPSVINSDNLLFILIYLGLVTLTTGPLVITIIKICIKKKKKFNQDNVLNEILSCPIYNKSFENFCKKEFSFENLLAFIEMNKLINNSKNDDKLFKGFYNFFNNFIQIGSLEVNIESKIRVRYERLISSLKKNFLEFKNDNIRIAIKDKVELKSEKERVSSEIKELSKELFNILGNNISDSLSRFLKSSDFKNIKNSKMFKKSVLDTI